MRSTLPLNKELKNMKPEMDAERASEAQPIFKNNIVADAIKLALAKLGQQYKIVGIDGGCEVRTRLASMGILPGQEIRVLKPGNSGPTMISVKGSRVALGRGVSCKILVRPWCGETGSPTA
jgi:Fe2+ transport system protein FeoA